MWLSCLQCPSKMTFDELQRSRITLIYTNSSGRLADISSSKTASAYGPQKHRLALIRQVFDFRGPRYILLQRPSLKPREAHLRLAILESLCGRCTRPRSLPPTAIRSSTATTKSSATPRDVLLTSMYPGWIFQSQQPCPRMLVSRCLPGRS